MRQYLVKTRCGKELLVHSSSGMRAAHAAKKHFPETAVIDSSYEIETVYDSLISKETFQKLDKPEAINQLRKQTGLNLIAAYEIVNKLHWHS